MTSVEKRRSGRKSGGRRKKSKGGFSDTSSAGSFQDETDREVSNLTDRAFRSLCIGDEAIYNDSDLCSSSPCSQRDKQLALNQSGRVNRGREELKRAASESFALRMQQYGQDWVHGGMPGAEICRDPQWDVYGEVTQGRASATFQHSYVETSQHDQSLREDQLSNFSNGATEFHGSQQRRSRSRVSTLIRTFNSDMQRDGVSTDGRHGEMNNDSSWDKSALMSIQRELSEFSNSYQQNYNSDHFPTAGHFSSRDANFYSSEAAGMAYVNSASSFTAASHSNHSMFSQVNCNSNFFIHSEFSPFKVWRNHNRFPFQQGHVSGFMQCSDFPKWYQTPMYKEIPQEAHPHGTYGFKERAIGYYGNNTVPMLAPSPPRATSTSTMLQKASAVEKRCESELLGHYTHRKRTQSLGAHKLTSQRPSTASPTTEISRRVRETISSVKALQQKLKMMTEQNMATGMTVNQQGALWSRDNVIPFGNNAATVAPNVVRGNTPPPNINPSLTPSVHSHQEAETSLVPQCAVSPQLVEHAPVRAESRGATPDIRMTSYKSRASNLLFNLKDNRRRVKTTYSPTKFKNPETANKQPCVQEPRDTIIDIPDFPDTDVQFMKAENSGRTHGAPHQYLNHYQNPDPPLATPTSHANTTHVGQYSEYALSDYHRAQRQGEMAHPSMFTGSMPENVAANQLTNGQSLHEDAWPFSPYKQSMTDATESQRGGVYGPAAPYAAAETPQNPVINAEQYFNETMGRDLTNVTKHQPLDDNTHDYSNVFSQDKWKQTNSQDTESLSAPWKNEISASLEKHAQGHQRAGMVKDELHSPRDKSHGENHKSMNRSVGSSGFGTSFNKSSRSVHPDSSNQLPQHASSQPAENEQPEAIRDKPVPQKYDGNMNENYSKDTYLIQNHYTDQDHRNQQALHSKDKAMFTQAADQRKQYLPVPNGGELQQVQATPQVEHKLQKSPISNPDKAANPAIKAQVKVRQFTEAKAEQHSSEHRKAQHAQAELAKAQHQAQVEHTKAESAKLILAGPTVSEEVNAPKARAEQTECEREKQVEAKHIQEEKDKGPQTEEFNVKDQESAQKLEHKRVQSATAEPRDMLDTSADVHVKGEQGEQVKAEPAEADTPAGGQIRTQPDNVVQARIQGVHERRETVAVEKVEEQVRVKVTEKEEEETQMEAMEAKEEQRQTKEQQTKTEPEQIKVVDVGKLKGDHVNVKEIRPAALMEDLNQVGRNKTEKPTKINDAKGATAEQQVHVELEKAELAKPDHVKEFLQPERAKTEFLKPELTKPQIPKSEPTKPEHANRELLKAEPGTLDLANPETLKAALTKPEQAKSEHVKTDHEKPEPVKPEHVKPVLVKLATTELTKSERVKPGETESELAKPELSKAQIAKHELVKAELTKPELANTENAFKPDPAKPQILNSVLAKTEPLYPDLIKSEFTKAVLSKPELAKPELVNPAQVKPQLAKTELEKSELKPDLILKPVLAKPEILKPQLVKPELAKPELVKPELQKQEVEKSELAQPESTPQILNSAPAKTEHLKPEVLQPELTKAELSKTELPRTELTKPELAKQQTRKTKLANPELGILELAKLELAKPELVKIHRTKPQLAKLELAKPELAKLELAKLELAKPVVAKTELLKSQLVKPELGKHGLLIPELARAELAKLELAKLELAKPVVAKTELGKHGLLIPELARAELLHKKLLTKPENLQGRLTKPGTELIKVHQVKHEPNKVEHVKTELAKAKAELAKIKDKTRGQKNKVLNAFTVMEEDFAKNNGPLRVKMHKTDNFKKQDQATEINQSMADSGANKCNRDSAVAKRELEKYSFTDVADNKTAALSCGAAETVKNKTVAQSGLVTANPESRPKEEEGKFKCDDDVTDGHYVYSESLKEFKLSTWTDSNTSSDAVAADKVDYRNPGVSQQNQSDLTQHSHGERKPKSIDPSSVPGKDLEHTPHKALSHKEKAQAKQDILTSKIKAHAEKEISALKDKSLRDGLISKNSCKQLPVGQPVCIRQRPPAQVASKKHDNLVSSFTMKSQMESKGIQKDTDTTVSPPGSATIPLTTTAKSDQVAQHSQKQVPKVAPESAGDAKQNGCFTTVVNLEANEKKRESQEEATKDKHAKQEMNYKSKSGKQKDGLTESSDTSTHHVSKKEESTAVLKAECSKIKDNPESKHEAVPEDSAPSINLVVHDQNKTNAVDDSLQIMGIMVTVRERMADENDEANIGTQEQVNTKGREGSDSELEKYHHSSGLRCPVNVQPNEVNTVKTKDRTVQELYQTEGDNEATIIMNNPATNGPESMSERKNNVSGSVADNRTNLQQRASVNSRAHWETELPEAEKGAQSTTTAPAKNKVSPETEPHLYKLDTIDRDTKDPANKRARESSTKNNNKEEVENTELTVMMDTNRLDTESRTQHNVCDNPLSMTENRSAFASPSQSGNIVGKSDRHVGTQLQPVNNSFNSLTEKQGNATLNEKHNKVDDVHIDGIAIRVVPAVATTYSPHLSEQPPLPIVPPDVATAPELSDFAPSSSKDLLSNPAGTEAPVRNHMEGEFGVQEVLLSVKKLSDALRNNSQQNNLNAAAGLAQAEEVRERQERSGDSSRMDPMEGGYFQFQGPEDSNNDLHNSTNNKESSGGVFKGGEQPLKAPLGDKSYKELQTEAYVLDPSLRKTLELGTAKVHDEKTEKKNSEYEGKSASKQTEPSTETPHNNEKLETGKHHTVNHSGSSSKETQSSIKSQPTRDSAARAKPEVKPKPRVSSIPEISALADYARLKVIVSEERENPIQEFPRNKKEGFFPLIQTRHSRRPVFSADPKEFSAKEKKLPNKTDISAKVNKEPKALVFPIREKEHQKTGMFKLGDKERQEKMLQDTPGTSDTVAKHAQSLKERIRSPTILRRNPGHKEQLAGMGTTSQADQNIPQTDNSTLLSSAANRPQNTSVPQHLMSQVNNEATSTKGKIIQRLDHPHLPAWQASHTEVGGKNETIEKNLPKTREERKEKLQHDHKQEKATVNQSEQNEASRVEDEKRAEEMRRRRIIEDSRASLAEEERRAAQREQERRAKEREAIALRIKERREKQREADKRAAEEIKVKQMKEAAQKEEEIRAKLEKEEAKVKESKRIKPGDSNAKLWPEKGQIKDTDDTGHFKQQQEERTSREEQLRRVAPWEQQRISAQERQKRSAAQERAALEKEKTTVQEQQQSGTTQREQQRKAELQELQMRAEGKQGRGAVDTQKTAAPWEQQGEIPLEEQERRAVHKGHEEENRKAGQENLQRTFTQREQQRRGVQQDSQRMVLQEQQLMTAVQGQKMPRDEEQRRTTQDEEKGRPTQEGHQNRVVQEEQQGSSAVEKQNLAALGELESRTTQGEQQRRDAQEEQQRRRALEKQRIAVLDEQETTIQRNISEEQEKAAYEKQKFTTRDEHQRRFFQEEQQRTTMQEQQQRMTIREEQQRKEELQWRNAVEKQNMAARDEHQRRSMQEEQQRRAEEEEEQQRVAQKEQQKIAAQEEQHRGAAQEQQRRAAQEEQQRIALQEEQHKISIQQEQQRRAVQEEQQMRAVKEEQKRGELQEEQHRRALHEEKQRRAVQEEEQRALHEEQQRGAVQEEEQRALHKEEQMRAVRKEEQRVQQEEQQIRVVQEQKRRALPEEQEEYHKRALQEEQHRRDVQEEEPRCAAIEGHSQRATLIEEPKQSKWTEEKVVSEFQEDKKRPWATEDRINVANEERTTQLDQSKAAEEDQESRDWVSHREAKKREEEMLAAQREKEKATRKEEQRRVTQMMDALQYYAIASTDSEKKSRDRGLASPLPSQRTSNLSVRESSDELGTNYTRQYRPHGSASPALPRSNSSSPALGAKPSMFRVKDNTIRGSSFTKPVKPRLYKNFGEDYRVGSPIERMSERGEEEHSARIPAQPDARSNKLGAIKELSPSRPASASQVYSTHYPQSRPLSRRSLAMDEDDSRSVISNVSEGVDSYATSAADLSDVRSLYDYDRPDSACSYSSDMSRSIGKPPAVPPKSEKALQRAKRLTTRRIKKELGKAAESSQAGVEKTPQEDPSIPASSSNEVDSSEHHAYPHFSSPITLAHAPNTSGTSSRRSFKASPHATGPVSLAKPHVGASDSVPVASPHATGPISLALPHVTASGTLPVAPSHSTGLVSNANVPETIAHVSSSPTVYHANHPAPVTQYHIEPSYPQSYPLTQRKVLQDLGSGQYFVVDVPVQVKTKTFFDPETGKYVQLNVRESVQSTSQPQLQQTYPQPQLHPQISQAKPRQPQSQAPTAGKPVLYQGYHGYPQGYPPTVINTVAPQRSSAPVTPQQNQQCVQENHSYGHQASETRENSEQGNRYSPEKTPYMDTVNDSEKTYNRVYNTHGSYEAFPECDTNSQLAGSSVCENDNSAHTQYQPRDIITMGELDDIMEMSDW